MLEYPPARAGPPCPASQPLCDPMPPSELPRHYLITPPGLGEEALLEGLAGALARGAALIQLRLRPGPGAGEAGLAARALALCRARGARLLLNGPPELALAWGMDGVHLSARRLGALGARPAAPPGWLVGASCHGPEELARAAALGLDLAVLSPVRPTASHPERPALGWARFAAWVAASGAGEAGLAVYALGGVGPGDLARACRAGAWGVAGIRAFWEGEGPLP